MLWWHFTISLQILLLNIVNWTGKTNRWGLPDTEYYLPQGRADNTIKRYTFGFRCWKTWMIHNPPSKTNPICFFLIVLNPIRTLKNNYRIDIFLRQIFSCHTSHNTSPVAQGNVKWQSVQARRWTGAKHQIYVTIFANFSYACFSLRRFLTVQQNRIYTVQRYHFSANKFVLHELFHWFLNRSINNCVKNNIDQLSLDPPVQLPTANKMFSVFLYSLFCSQFKFNCSQFIVFFRFFFKFINYLTNSVHFLLRCIKNENRSLYFC